MDDILQQPLTAQILALLVLSAVVGCVAWTVTHEEVFREPRDFCVQRSKAERTALRRKFFYLFTCEYCFSHYVAAAVVLGTGYHLLLPDWRGMLVAWFTLVWVANFQMSAYARIRLEVKLDRIEIQQKTEESGNGAAPGVAVRAGAAAPAVQATPDAISAETPVAASGTR